MLPHDHGQQPQSSTAAGSGGGGGGNWTGLTIKEILEKVDLFNVTVEEDEDSIKKEKVLVGRHLKAGMVRFKYYYFIFL